MRDLQDNNIWGGGDMFDEMSCKTFPQDDKKEGKKSAG